MASPHPFYTVCHRCRKPFGIDRHGVATVRKRCYYCHIDYCDTCLEEHQRYCRLPPQVPDDPEYMQPQDGYTDPMVYMCHECGTPFATTQSYAGRTCDKCDQLIAPGTCTERHARTCRVQRCGYCAQYVPGRVYSYCEMCSMVYCSECRDIHSEYCVEQGSDGGYLVPSAPVAPPVPSSASALIQDSTVPPAWSPTACVLCHRALATNGDHECQRCHAHACDQCVDMHALYCGDGGAATTSDRVSTG